MLDIDANRTPLSIEVDNQSVGDLALVGPRPSVEVDIQGVGFRVVEKLNPFSSWLRIWMSNYRPLSSIARYPHIDHLSP